MCVGLFSSEFLKLFLNMKKLLVVLGLVLMFSACENLDILDDLPQGVKDAMIELDEDSFSFKPEGGSKTIVIKTSSVNHWQATCKEEWVIFTDAVSGNGNGEVEFSIPSNTGKSRKTTIYIDGETSEGRHSVREVSVRQDGKQSEQSEEE